MTEGAEKLPLGQFRKEKKVLAKRNGINTILPFDIKKDTKFKYQHF